MGIRANGRKKSSFPAQETIPDSATLDFVSAGANYKILYSDLVAQLNDDITIVTGNYADIYIRSSAITTTCNPDTPTLLLGTWASGLLSNFTATAAGRLTYNRQQDFVARVHVDLEFSESNDFANLYEVEIYKNGVATGVKRAINLDTGSNYSAGFSGLIECEYGDYLELYVMGSVFPNIITVTNCSFTVSS